jgi:hypothetical protein
MEEGSGGEKLCFGRHGGKFMGSILKESRRSSSFVVQVFLVSRRISPLLS